MINSYKKEVIIHLSTESANLRPENNLRIST